MHSNIPRDLIKLLDVSPKTQVIPRNHIVFVAKPSVGTVLPTEKGSLLVESEDEFVLTRFEGDYLKFTLSDIDVGERKRDEGLETLGFNFCDYRNSKGTSLASSLRDVKVVFDWKCYKSTLSPYSNYGTYLKSSMDFSEENLREYGYLGLSDNHFVKIGNVWFVLSDSEYKFYFTNEIETYKRKPISIVDESSLDWEFVYKDFKAYCNEIRRNSDGVLQDGHVGCSSNYTRGKTVFKCNLEALKLPSNTKLDEREVTISYTYDKLHKQYTLRARVMSPDFKTSNIAFSLQVPYNEVGRAVSIIKRMLKSSLGKKTKSAVKEE